jgi:hypothetical protein
MFNAVSSVPVDCNLILVARVLGATLVGLAVVALEAWLRVPVQPLLDGYLHMAQSRAAAVVRRLSF